MRKVLALTGGLFGLLIVALCVSGNKLATAYTTPQPVITVSPPIPTTLSTATAVIPKPLATSNLSATATWPPPPTIAMPATPTATPQPTATATATVAPSPTAPPFPTPAATMACRQAAPTTPNLAVPAGPWPRPPAHNSVIGRGPGDPGTKLIHLSFDVEGDPSVLNALLNVLDRHQVKTTMFVVGSWAEQNSYWIAEIKARGHEFGNHTYSHADLQPLAAEEVQEELQKTEAVVERLTGQSTKPWMRPPYGRYSQTAVQAAYEAGWTTVLWTSSGVDTDPDANETTICNALVQYATPGSILLMHTSNPAAVSAVDRFITEMNARGYTFVPLSVLVNGL